ncbi:MAG: ABC transporter ATP-binding protein [Thermoguttaceae bacterium]|jgi:ATP-binding cassette subfamily B multidrug efflux pump
MTGAKTYKQTRNERLATLKKVWSYLKEYRFRIALTLTFATLATLATLYIPLIIGRAIDCIVGPGQVDFRGVAFAAVEIMGCAAFVAFAQYFMTLNVNRIAYGVARDVRVDALRKIEELPLSYLDARQYGETTSRIVTDADVFTDGLLLGFSQLFTGVVSIVGVLFFMMSISVPIALVVVALTPASLLVAGFISKKSFVFFKDQSEYRGALTGYANETTHGARVIKAFDRAESAEREFSELDARLTKSAFLATFYSSLTNPATRFVNSLVYASVGCVGALVVLRGQMTVGQLVTFLSYANQYTKPFNEISGVVTEFQNARACASRLFEFIDAESRTPDPVDALHPNSFRGEVEFDNVCFSYLPERPLIENFNLHVAPGSRVAIVGPTGCGKTTLVNLLMRFYDVDSGAIRIDGMDSQRIARSSLRSGFGMVLQETWLKSGSVRENILMGARDVGETELRQIAKACQIDAFVDRLPQGFDTFVTESGDEFSLGQRQLLCIARVMARNPEILILDEATSSIDTRSELKIQRALNALMTGRTSFVVAHRLSTVRNADVILAMKDGSIVEQGTHDELFAKRGFYYDLFMSQFPSRRA